MSAYTVQKTCVPWYAYAVGGVCLSVSVYVYVRLFVPCTCTMLESGNVSSCNGTPCPHTTDHLVALRSRSPPATEPS